MALRKSFMAPCLVPLFLAACWVVGGKADVLDSADTMSFLLSAPTLSQAPPGFTAPPDTLPLLPPVPPMLPSEDIGSIRRIEDVCRVCSGEHSFLNTTCLTKKSLRCMEAMNQFRTKVMQLPERVCSCYNTIAVKLLQTCPNVDKTILYLQNCDFFCFYGPPCPFRLTLYSLLSPKFVKFGLQSNNTLAQWRNDSVAFSNPASRGSAAVLLDLLPDTVNGNRTCYHLYPSDNLPQPIRATIRFGKIGQIGRKVLTLFSPLAPFGRAGCRLVPFWFLQKLSEIPTLFYIQLDTIHGSIRGQIVIAPHLFAIVDNNQAQAPCRGRLCLGAVDLSFTYTSLGYKMSYSKAVRRVRYGTIEKGLKTPTRFVPLFSPYMDRDPPMANSGTPNSTLIFQLLAEPLSFSLNVATIRVPGGALRGQLHDAWSVVAVMYGYQVRPASGVPGMGVFLATFGAGGICYKFAFTNVPIVISYAYIHSGVSGTRGGVFVPQALPMSVNSQYACVAVDPELTGAILSGAMAYYVQAYTADSTSGVLRGQLYIAPVME